MSPTPPAGAPTPPPPSPDPPSLAVRVALGFVIAIAAFDMALPLAILASVILIGGLFVSAAVALAHTGALEHDAFHAAHWSGPSVLLSALVAAYVYRAARPATSGVLRLLARSPLVTASLALPPLTLLCVVLAWGSTGYALLAGASVLTTFFFFGIAGTLVALYLVVRTAHRTYRWGATSPYRAGIVTGVLLIPVALLLALRLGGLAAHASASTAAAPTRLETLAHPRHVALAASPTPSTDIFESERLAFLLADGVIEHGASVFDPPPTFGTLVQPPTEEDRLVVECIERLAKSDVRQVERTITKRFQLSEGDVHDIVYEALLNVCLAHARAPYENPAAILQVAAARDADRWRERRGRECAVEEPPSCTPSPDENVRFEQEKAVINDVICREDPETKKIIYMRVVEDKSFPEIGAVLDIPADKAREKWNNFVRRARAALVKKCGS